MMMNVNEAALWLSQRDNFLIITHRRPDGDAIGCAGALALGLNKIGKTAYVLKNSETTPRYLPYIEKRLAPEDYCPDFVIVVDTASYGLFPENADKYKGAVSLCIDHHPSNTGYAENLCLDATRASCGEVMYDILIALCGDIDPEIAACLYVAISTDTGCFAYGNTTANSLRTAALTVEAGAPHRPINRKLFRTKTKGRVKLEGMIYSGIEYLFDGRAAIATITNAMADAAGADEDDMDDIASIPGSVKGVYVGITIRELSGPRDCKVSVRTSPNVNANDLCELFGGGGHAMAAGFTANLTAQEIRLRLISALSDILTA